MKNPGGVPGFLHFGEPNLYRWNIQLFADVFTQPVINFFMSYNG